MLFKKNCLITLSLDFFGLNFVVFVTNTISLIELRRKIKGTYMKGFSN